MDCEICGERIREGSEIGEFWVEEMNDSVLAHAQCGLDKHYPIA